MDASLASTEFEHQALVITVPNEFKETVGPQSSLSDLLQNTTPFTESKNSLLGSNVSLIDEMEIQGAFSSASSTVIHDSKFRKIKSNKTSILQLKLKFPQTYLLSPLWIFHQP